MRKFNLSNIHSKAWLVGISVMLSQSYAIASKDFVKACLGKEPKVITCRTAQAMLILNDGKRMTLTQTSKPGFTTALPVVKIQRQPHRLAASGLREESVTFIALTREMVATIDIPCGQTQFGYVGLSNNTQAMPGDNVALCQIE